MHKIEQILQEELRLLEEEKEIRKELNQNTFSDLIEDEKLEAQMELLNKILNHLKNQEEIAKKN